MLQDWLVLWQFVSANETSNETDSETMQCSKRLRHVNNSSYRMIIVLRSGHRLRRKNTLSSKQSFKPKTLPTSRLNTTHSNMLSSRPSRLSSNNKSLCNKHSSIRSSCNYSSNKLKSIALTAVVLVQLSNDLRSTWDI